MALQPSQQKKERNLSINFKLKKFNLLAQGWLLVVILLLTHNVYLWFDKHITPNTDILALLPLEKRDPVLQHAFQHMVDTAQQHVVVLIGAKNWEESIRAADAYIAVIKTHPDYIHYNDVSLEKTQSDWLALFQKSRLNLLTFVQQTALKTKPAQYWVDTALSKLYSPFAGLKLGSWQDDPFSLFSGWAQAHAQETPVRPRDGKLFVADKDYYYILIMMDLCQPAFAMSTQKNVIPLLESAQLAARQINSQIKIITTGVVLHAAMASTQANKEMSTIGLGSLLGILLLMWLTFRSLKPMLFIGLSIGVGCLGAISISWLLFGQIHLLTLVFGASLIGIAQDYGIYFLCSRLAENSSSSSQKLLQNIFTSLGLTLTAALIGYLGLALTPFPSLRQMAVFSGLGLIFAWLTVVCWFPQLVHPPTLKLTLFTQRFGMMRLHWPLFQRDRKTYLIAFLFFILVILGCSKLTVSDDIRALQKPSPALISDQLKLNQLLAVPSPAQFYLVRGNTPEIVLQREEALKQQLEPLISKHIISGYQATSNWIPSLQMQTSNQQLMAQTLLSTNGPLKMLAQKLDENTSWIINFKNHLLNASVFLTLENFFKTSASEPWQYLWLGKVNNEYASIVAIRGLTDYANLPVLKQIAMPLSGTQWVDKIADISSVLKQYRQYMSWVVMSAYIALYGLLFFRYKNTTWRIIMPPAIASISTLALLGIMNLPLQLFHVLALMLILGLGVDYGIFLQEHPHRDEYHAWLTVSLSAISALLSFGLLALSNTPPLHAFGLTMLIGMTIVWLLAPCFCKRQVY